MFRTAALDMDVLYRAGETHQVEAPARLCRWWSVFTTLLVFPLLTPLDFFRVWPPTAPVWYRSVLEVIDPAVFFLHFASATLLMRNITSSMLFCFLSCKSRADGICRVSWLFEFLRYSGFEQCCCSSA